MVRLRGAALTCAAIDRSGLPDSCPIEPPQTRSARGKARKWRPHGQVKLAAACPGHEGDQAIGSEQAATVGPNATRALSRGPFRRASVAASQTRDACPLGAPPRWRDVVGRKRTAMICSFGSPAAGAIGPVGVPATAAGEYCARRIAASGGHCAGQAPPAEARPMTCSK
jgi:hypothetical protein